jgi:extracellular elastinolytic metalloproteinase
VWSRRATRASSCRSDARRTQQCGARTCDANRGANCATDAGYNKRYTSPADAFPATSTRPVSPHLLLRQFDIPNTKATHVRFVVKSTQCTGAPSYQGEQDSDPTAATDCDTATPAVSDPNFARAAEFQVFRRHSNIDD